MRCGASLSFCSALRRDVNAAQDALHRVSDQHVSEGKCTVQRHNAGRIQYEAGVYPTLHPRERNRLRKVEFIMEDEANESNSVEDCLTSDAS